jgi:hypothetical protein
MTKTSNSQSLPDEKNPVGDTKLEQLEKKLAEQALLIEKLLNQSNKVGRPPKTKEELHQDIRPDAYIKIMSLDDHELNLSTQKFGRGKTLTFTHFGETKKCLYSELLDIINNHSNFFEQGKFYILDEGKGIIRELGKDDLYEHILTKEKIESIINSSPDAFNLFQSANQGQQKTIINMLIAKMRDGVAVDHNLISDISRFSGIKIEEKVEEAIQDTKFEEELKKNNK